MPTKKFNWDVFKTAAIAAIGVVASFLVVLSIITNEVRDILMSNAETILVSLAAIVAAITNIVQVFRKPVL